MLIIYNFYILIILLQLILHHGYSGSMVRICFEISSVLGSYPRITCCEWGILFTFGAYTVPKHVEILKHLLWFLSVDEDIDRVWQMLHQCRVFILFWNFLGKILSVLFRFHLTSAYAVEFWIDLTEVLYIFERRIQPNKKERFCYWEWAVMRAAVCLTLFNICWSIWARSLNV